MNPQTIKRYASFYRSCNYMGVAKILRDHLGVASDFPIPLSLSHGVDMNHCATAMDVDSIEPIHWCTNPDIYSRAIGVKPCILIPHPWVLLDPKPSAAAKGTLVVGPPPGRINDEALRDSLKRAGISSYDMLLKYRGNVDSSTTFWRDSGISVVTAGDFTHEQFYHRLADVLGKYERVIGCTVSSALFFAASMGVRCELLTDYRYTVYEVGGYLKTADFSAPTARKFVKLLLDDDQAGARTLSRFVLGSELPCEPARLLGDLKQHITALKSPIHLRGRSRLVQFPKAAVARLIRRPGLMDLRLRRLVGDRLRRTASILEINEVDVWANGMSSANIRCEDVTYVPGETNPGFAPTGR